MSGAIRAHCASVSRIFSLARPPDRSLAQTQVPIRVNRPYRTLLGVHGRSKALRTPGGFLVEPAWALGLASVLGLGL